jgi:hypothetical protein
MKLYTFSYNTDYNPSAPFVEIELIDYDERQTPINLLAQVDSGADSSAIPLSMLRRVKARYEETRVMRDMSGFTQPVDMYLVAIGLVNVTFYCSVMALHGHEAIIGRDILNHLTVTLNGPATMTEILIDSAT